MCSLVSDMLKGTTLGSSASWMIPLGGTPKGSPGHAIMFDVYRQISYVLETVFPALCANDPMMDGHT